MKMWTKFMWFRLWSSGEILWTRYWTLVSHKRRGIIDWL